MKYQNGHWARPRYVGHDLNLDSVACGSRTFCLVADDSGNLLFYNGRSSFVNDPPYVSYGYLGFAKPFYVSCASTSFCAAQDGNKVTFLRHRRWGKPMRLRGAGPGSPLSDLSCASRSFCAVVTAYSTAAIWNGRRWSRFVSLRFPGDNMGNSGAEQVNVSCASSRLCAAVDSFDHVATFNGRSWSAPRLLDAIGNASNRIVAWPRGREHYRKEPHTSWAEIATAGYAARVPSCGNGRPG